MVSKKGIGEFLKKHRWISPVCSLLLFIIICAGVLELILAYNENVLNKRAETMETGIDSGLAAPKLVAVNFGPSNATETFIYSLDDPECGFTLKLIVCDWGMNPPASINGKRAGKITALPQEGFKQISVSVAKNLKSVPEIYRYVNLSQNEVIYYERLHGSSCRFNLFESIQPA